ncbi:hypothetical protein Poli38472_006104 [Pythium oligandrum]|uniref:Uncharacterized protein n=1 Tax=Pythium oligandrum TaxID=41045 RepID=A0A8K1CU33_PYTOL|nr:hypothetical protein Poli38472_006104 [Pythium oligandrum]|eukprot:TMW68636.1 hypothetical protein Poli38472_006104 [Pythium oligandrum]
MGVRMRCHYEVLAIERDASPKDVKKAFHLQALKFHPDKHQKNNITPEEATQRFQEIQNAYEVLSDPHERKWYDEHREQILRGDDDEDGGANENELNLFKFFSASVYTGFGDDEKSFYSVYGALFTKIDELDCDTLMTSSYTPERAPGLGNCRTSIDEVSTFYQHWMSYVTQRSFAWVDEYKTTDAPTRQIRRAMEKENKKLRDAAKKAFTAEVRELVEFVRKRDPRMIAYQKQKEQDKAEQQRLEEQRKKDKQAAYEAERLAFQQQEMERWENEKQHTSRLAEDHIQEELDRLRKKMDADMHLCDICNKSFKSTKQLKNHLTSKKHKDREIELGIVSEFDIEDALDLELQAELEEMRRAKKQEAAINLAMDELAVEDDEEESEEQRLAAERAAALEAQKEREREAAAQLRQEKDQKAADKRAERKLQRKEKKKAEVEKIVSVAKGKASKEDDDEGRKSRKKKR